MPLNDALVVFMFYVALGCGLLVLAEGSVYVLRAVEIYILARRQRREEAKRRRNRDLAGD